MTESRVYVQQKDESEIEVKPVKTVVILASKESVNRSS